MIPYDKSHTCILCQVNVYNTNEDKQDWVQLGTGNTVHRWCAEKDNLSFITELEEEGLRYNQGKPLLGHIPPKALEDIAKVFTYGANKYKTDNWLKGLKYRDTIGSLLRHVIKFAQGETIDSESGLSHLSHVGANVLFLMEFEEHPDKYKRLDDRYEYGKAITEDEYKELYRGLALCHICEKLLQGVPTDEIKEVAIPGSSEHILAHIECLCKRYGGELYIRSIS